MKKLILPFFLLMLFIPKLCLGKECTSEQLTRYKKLASEIQTTFDYEETTDDISFTIYFHNVYKKLYLVNYQLDDYIVINPNDDEDVLSISNVNANTTYTFSVLNDDSECDTQVITRIKVSTPNYNRYYKDALCEGIETYSLCQKWSNLNNLSYNEFKKSAESYKKQLETNQTPVDDPIINTSWDNFRNFIANNYIYIVLVSVAVTFGLIALYKKRKKNTW